MTPREQHFKRNLFADKQFSPENDIREETSSHEDTIEDELRNKNTPLNSDRNNRKESFQERNYETGNPNSNGANIHSSRSHRDNAHPIKTEE